MHKIKSFNVILTLVTLRLAVTKCIKYKQYKKNIINYILKHIDLFNYVFLKFFNLLVFNIEYYCVDTVIA